MGSKTLPIVLLNCLVCVSANTIHFTNSKMHMQNTLKSLDPDAYVKTYQLEVPGSKPITVIEADPPDIPIRRPKVIGEDRKTKDYIVPGSTHETDTNEESSRCVGPSCHDSQKKTVYSPELLNKFLQEYAERIKNADQKIKDRLHQMEVLAEDDDAGSNKAYQKKKITEKIDIQVQPDDVKKATWHQIDPKKQKHPYDDDDGWVTLEAVPWTKTKISKWQANSHNTIRPSSSSFPYNIDRYSSSNYDRPDSDYDSYNFARPKPNKFGSRPSQSYGSSDEWEDDTPSRPSWMKPYKPSSYRPASWNADQQQDCDHENEGYQGNRKVSYYYDNGGIITDGRPNDFPTSSQGHRFKDHLFRRPTEFVYPDSNSEHPLSHPINGDGQWVLLSTTKGFQIPKKRQRSLSISPSALTTRMSVKLDVLPAKGSSEQNTTTSHGGMLEVDPSFQSVEESKLMMQKKNSTRVRPLKLQNLVAAADTSQDGAAVMAAVGAGLVPATVAMMMPIVLGRRRRRGAFDTERSDHFDHTVTQHPWLIYESTLQRTMNE